MESSKVELIPWSAVTERVEEARRRVEALREFL